ncbi:MAG: HigA family addiction module antidote protein [Alphaproteobacteria bacterium]|nr:HigA family addiction module antidote protein [Alphaproteobacteria bacterium]
MLAVHPGQALRLELDTRGLSANALALALRVPSGRITEILGGKRAITPETALRLGRYFGTGPELWLNLQTAYDLATVENEMGERIVNEVQPAA